MVETTANAVGIISSNSNVIESQRNARPRFRKPKRTWRWLLIWTSRVYHGVQTECKETASEPNVGYDIEYEESDICEMQSAEVRPMWMSHLATGQLTLISPHNSNASTCAAVVVEEMECKRHGVNNKAFENFECIFMVNETQARQPDKKLAILDSGGQVGQSYPVRGVWKM